MWKEFLLMGETLEYLESLYKAGDFEALEDCGECLSDWGVTKFKRRVIPREDIMSKNTENKVYKPFMLKSVKWTQVTIKNPICPVCGNKSKSIGFEYNTEKKLKIQLFECPSCGAKGRVKA